MFCCKIAHIGDIHIKNKHIEYYNLLNILHDEKPDIIVLVGDIIDSIIESYQGKYDIVKGYKSLPIVDYENSQQLISYFKSLVQTVSDKRKSIKESYLQNQIDNIEQLIYSTLYKLRNLK